MSVFRSDQVAAEDLTEGFGLVDVEPWFDGPELSDRDVVAAVAAWMAERSQ